VTYPNGVIGFAEGSFMNLGTSLGLYAAVTKEPSTELVSPDSERFYVGFHSFTRSKLHARFCIWAALEPRAAGQAFNVVNGDVESWRTLWPKLAKRFGLRVKPDQLAKPPGEEGAVMELAEKPPVADMAAELGLVGSRMVQQGKVEQRVDLMKWSKREDVRKAWEKVAEREGLSKDALEKATWGFLGFVLGRNYDLVIDMSKARTLGWTGWDLNLFFFM